MELEDYPGYLIYQDGKIWSKKSKKWLSHCIRWKYKSYALTDSEGRRNTVSLHTLVATAYILNPNNYPCINHKNLDKLDNRIENLEWCSHIYNAQSVRQLGRPFGSVHFLKGNTKFPSYWVFEFHDMGKRNMMYFKTQEEAEEYREITKLFYEGLMLD